MSRSGPIVSRTIALIVIALLIVSVVVRSYGWQLILANTPAGLLNWMLMSLGITSEPLAILYSETAVVIGSLHVFFPMMVLPLASALGKIDPNLEDCARTWAPWWKVLASPPPRRPNGRASPVPLPPVSSACSSGVRPRWRGNLIEQIFGERSAVRSRQQPRGAWCSHQDHQLSMRLPKAAASGACHEPPPTGPGA